MENKNSPKVYGRKTAIVTGSSGNLGQAVVKKFIGEGYKVIGTVTSIDKSVLDFPADQFEKMAVNLIDENETVKFTDKVISKYETVDVAVLTVGGFALGDIAGTTTADIQKQFQLNFETTYNIARPVFVQMMKQGYGRIIIIGSKPGLDAQYSKGMVAYGLGKSLVFRLAELMNDEAKGKVVVTSVVVPETIDTPQNRSAMPDANFNEWIKPETLAEIIYMHCESHTMPGETVIKVYGKS
jgi:NAD(P)-dependent dehydrogenase (short-subunit alcohol dehydrogenase family)